MPFKNAADKKRYQAKYLVGHRARNRAMYKASQSAYAKRLHDAMFDHYGRRCICCGETDEAVLSIDHVNNDGGKHRRMRGTTNPTGIHRWAKKHGYPNTLQTMCISCNAKKWWHGRCPCSD